MNDTTKKLINLFLTLLLVNMIPVPVITIAQETTILPEPGITPDHPFYGLDRAFESLQMVFTFGDDAKARLQVKFADERIAETKAMIDKDKPEYIPSLMEDYRNHLNFIERVSSSKPQDTSLQELVAVSTSIHQTILNTLLEKAPPEAIHSLERARQVSIKGQEEALTVIKNTEGEATLQDIQKKIEQAEIKSQEALERIEINSMMKERISNDRYSR